MITSQVAAALHELFGDMQQIEDQWDLVLNSVPAVVTAKIHVTRRDSHGRVSHDKDLSLLVTRRALLEQIRASAISTRNDIRELGGSIFDGQWDCLVGTIP